MIKLLADFISWIFNKKTLELNKLQEIDIKHLEELSCGFNPYARVFSVNKSEDKNTEQPINVVNTNSRTSESDNSVINLASTWVVCETLGIL